jgi:hypothetical protein
MDRDQMHCNLGLFGLLFLAAMNFVTLLVGEAEAE